VVGVTPVGAQDAAGYLRLPGDADAAAEFATTLTVLFGLAVVTLLKGKVWTALFAVFVPPLMLVGAIRIARPGSPWARWRYQDRPKKLAKASYRERRLRRPVISAKIWLQDMLAGHHDVPSPPTAARSSMRDTFSGK